MKKNILKYFAYGFVAATALTLGSCSSDDSYDVEGNPNNLIYFRAGAANSNEFTATVKHTPVGDFSDLKIKLPLYIQRAVPEGTVIGIAQNNSYIAEYNEKNNTEYVALPEEALDIIKSYVTFKADTLASTDSIEVALKEEALAKLTAPEYLLPLAVSNINGEGTGELPEGVVVLPGGASGELAGSVERGVIYVKINTTEDQVHISSSDEVKGTIAHTPVGSFGGLTLDMPARVSNAAKVGATATITVDNSLIMAYNAAHSTTYVAMPDGILNIENATVTIEEGSTTSSTNFKASVPEDKLPLLTEAGYIVPLKVSVKRADGVEYANAGTIYMIVTTEQKLVNSAAGSSKMPVAQVETADMASWTVDTGDLISNVTDNKTNTYWRVSNGEGTWIIDMQSVKNFGGLSVRSQYTNYGAVYGLSEAQIQLSEDGNTWVDCGVASQSDLAYENPYQVLTLYGAVPARYIKMSLKWNYSNYARVTELRVWAE